MQKDAFKPQGREISVMGMMNPLAGGQQQRMVPMAQPPGRQQQQQQHAPAPLPMDPASRGAAISSTKPVPRGAHEVRLAGTMAPPLDGAPVDRGASFQPPGSAPVQEFAPSAPSPVMAQAPRPYMQRPQNGSRIFRVTTRYRGLDGAEYEAPYDAVLPAGAELMGAPEVIPLS
jgi:hypothetical protein